MKFKNTTQSINVSTGKAIKFENKDFTAIKINGKVKIVPNNVANKLVELKRATLEKGVEIEVEKREGVTVKDLKTTK